MSRKIIEHEVLHAMGIFHEQSRVDRDEHIIIYWDNIKPEYHSQYRALSIGQWLNSSVAYDKDSVMHYPHNGFITSEANQAKNSTMVDKVTLKPVQKPRAGMMSGRDAIQLQKMYADFCPPFPLATCLDGLPYLLSKRCDGEKDCALGDNDQSDERNCNNWCERD